MDRSKQEKNKVHPTQTYVSATEAVKGIDGKSLAEDRRHATAGPQDCRWPVCQPWFYGAQAEEQRLEALPFAGLFAGDSKTYIQFG